MKWLFYQLFLLPLRKEITKGGFYQLTNHDFIQTTFIIYIAATEQCLFGSGDIIISGCPGRCALSRFPWS